MTTRNEHSHRRARISLLPLIAVMYLTISGGAYGLEDAVRIAGARWAILLCLIVPLTLSLPTALMASELTALFPVEGGFYFWVKEALGPFAGFAEAYLTLLYTAVDMAIYPVMFVSYLSFLAPGLMGGNAIWLAVALVWAAGILNLLGVRPVGNASTLLGVALLSPFAALVLFGLPRLIHWVPPVSTTPQGGLLAGIGGALTVVIWNFGGWENQSVIAEEMEHPQRNYLRAITYVLPLVVLGYVLPLAVSVSGSTGTAEWKTGWFSQVGSQIGGPWLGAALAIGGLISSFSVFEAGMLWVSRMPFVLAREGYLPRSLADLSKTTAIPVRAILLCCIVFSLLVRLGFTALIVMDVFFYMTAMVLEMAALVRLRRLRPKRAGLFRIPGGNLGLYATVALPMLTWIATFGIALNQEAGGRDFVIAVALAITTFPAFFFCKWLFGGPQREHLGGHPKLMPDRVISASDETVSEPATG